jgi:hypothetical protein
MSKTQSKAKFGPHELDVRVRERFLASGALDAKVLEKHLAELKDVSANAEALDLRQPAVLGGDEADDAADES